MRTLAAAALPDAPASGHPRLGWVRALVEPGMCLGWTLADWDRAVRLARRHRLLARLAHALGRAGLSASVPNAVRAHLEGARLQSQSRMRSMRWTIERLPGMLNEPTYPLVLLKGAAYLGQGLPIADGRLPSDLDILLPQRNIEEARFFLRRSGWREPELDAHDRRYYEQWSHELPPMRHPRSGMELDVHWNIQPARSGRMPDIDVLFEGLEPSAWPHWSVLAPADQLLHSAVHLFFDAEPRDRVRDLIDLDGLFRHFGSRPGFAQDLVARATQLGFESPLALAIHFTRRWLGTPMDECLQEFAVRSFHASVWMRTSAHLFATILLPTEPDARDSLAKRGAAFAILATYQLERLPLQHLVPHLWHKAFARTRRASSDTPTGT